MLSLAGQWNFCGRFENIKFGLDSISPCLRREYKGDLFDMFRQTRLLIFIQRIGGRKDVQHYA